MKKLLSLVALVTVVAVAGVAVAGECPLLTKQLAEAKVSDPKKAADVKKLTAEAEQLHKDGKHAESVQKSEEAAKIAGIELKRKAAK